MPLIVDHPNLGRRPSLDADELKAMRSASAFFEKQIDVETPQGVRPVRLFTVEGYLFGGDCIALPALTTKGRLLTAGESQSLADQFIARTIEEAELYFTDPLSSLATHADTSKSFGSDTNGEFRLKLENVMADKSRRLSS